MATIQETHSCDNCPSARAYLFQTYQDRCSTDRGEEVRDMELWLCDDCAERYTAQGRP
jgi:hypothetical protein